MDTLLTILKSNPPTNAVDLIKIVKSYVAHPEQIVPILEKIAAGADGISGTDDDIISPDLVLAVKTLLDLQLVQHIASEIKVPQGCLACLSA